MSQMLGAFLLIIILLLSLGIIEPDQEFGSIDGYVFIDENLDNIFNDAELPVENCSIMLRSGVGDITPILSDSNGYFFFGSLPLEEYEVTCTPNPGMNLKSEGEIVVNLGAEDTSYTLYFGMALNEESVEDSESEDLEPELTPASNITGIVYHDFNSNLELDENEHGLANFTVSLYNDTILLSNQITDNEGLFVFNQIHAGTYDIVLNILGNWYNTTPRNITTLIESNTTQAFYFGVDSQEYTDIDEEEHTITRFYGLVYNDRNQNQVKDIGESGIVNVPILLKQGDELILNTTTGSKGEYVFNITEPGQYVIQEINLINWVSTTPDVFNRTIEEGQEIRVNFGDYKKPIPPLEYLEIYGKVFNDVNGDAKWENDETGIMGVNVSLYKGEVLVSKVETNQYGSYSFSLQENGYYWIESESIGNMFHTTPNMVFLGYIIVGDEYEVDFGYAYNTSEFSVVFGSVFNDFDGNGIRDLDEMGLKGANVSILYEDIILSSYNTSTNKLPYGAFSFRVNKTGLYKLVEVNPPTYRSTTSDSIPLLVYTLGREYRVDFGDTNNPAFLSIYGTVFNDTNCDGLLSLGESGIPGVNVTIDEYTSVTTDINGIYSFSSISEGFHVINEIDLFGWVSTTPNAYSINIENGQSYEFNFGDSLSSHIQGHIFIDSNVNGLLDLDEKSIPYCPVSLIVNSTYIVVTTTDLNGSYEFTNLPSGNYRVVGFNTSLLTGVHNSTLTDVNLLVQAGKSYTIDMGYYVADSFSAIIGGVYLDLNITGNLLPFDMGIPLSGVEITLENSTWVGYNSTNEVGIYFFIVTPGDYNLTEIDPSINGLYSTTPNFVQVSVENMEIVFVDFRDTINRAGLVSYAYNDMNLNQKHDAGEAIIPEVEIRIYNGTELVLSSSDATDISFSGFGFSLPFLNVDIFNLFGFNPFNMFGGSSLGGLISSFGGLFGGIFELPDYSGLFKIPASSLGLAPGFNTIWFSTQVIRMNNIYLFLLEPGNYTVFEIDPEGYASTTSNQVNIEVYSVNLLDITKLPNVTFGDAKEVPSITVKKQVYGQLLPDPLLSVIQSLQNENILFFTPFGNIFNSLFGGFFGSSLSPEEITTPTWRDFVIVFDNETLEFRYTITNNGTTPLSNIHVLDDILGPITIPKNSLEPGEEFTVYINETTKVGQHQNIVNVNATYHDKIVSVWDAACYLGLGSVPMNVSISKQVSVNPEGPWSEHVNLTAGEDNVYFNITIINESNVTLSGLTLFDTVVGELTLSNDILAPGEKVELLYNHTANEGFVENMVVVYAALPQDIGVKFGYESGFAYLIAMDNASYTGQIPNISISVDKRVAATGIGPWFEHINIIEGSSVYYNVTVSNTGNGDLTDVYVEDSEKGILWNGIELARGESKSTIYSTIALHGDHNNTVEANGTWILTPISTGDEDNASYTGLDIPSISLNVIKQVSNVSSIGPWFDHVEVIAGVDKVWYNITITNTGTEDLYDIYIHDYYHYITAPKNMLSPGESMNAIYWYYAEYGYIENLVEVTGTWYGDYPVYVYNHSSAAYHGVLPFVELKVEKKVSTNSTGPWFEHVDAIAGEDLVYFNVTLTNIGNVTINDITVFDESTATWFTPINMPFYLDSGASMSAIYYHPAYNGLYYNEVFVSGYWAGYNGYTLGVYKTDTASYTGKLPRGSIEVEKKVSNESYNGPWVEHVASVAGEDRIYFNVTVTNTGAYPLDEIKVEDALGVFNLPKSNLSPGESTWVNYSIIAKPGYVVNTVNVSGKYETTYNYYSIIETDTDEASYTGLYPGIMIDKQIKGRDGVWYDNNVEFLTGENVQCRFIITNTGGFNLSNLTLTDDLLGTIYLPNNNLTAGNSITGYKNSTAILGFHQNNATVTAEYYGNAVFDSDIADYTGFEFDEVNKDFYVAYERWLEGDYDYNDFGMKFSLEEYHVDGYLFKIRMNFTAMVYSSGLDHLIHIKRPLNGGSTVTIDRPNPWPTTPKPILGENETPEGTYYFDNIVDIILYNTEKYTYPQKKMGENIGITITIHDPYLNPVSNVLTSPRVFTNKASEPFYDLDPIMQLYDPYQKAADGKIININYVCNATKFGYIEVPYILVLDNPDWIPPYEVSTITGPYEFFDDYYSYGTPENWYTKTMVSNNIIGPEGLSWGPYD